MIKYKTGGYKHLIEEKEIIRETEKMVFYKGWKDSEQREAKKSTYSNYFDTWEEAHKFLMDKAQSNVDGLRERLERAKAELGNIKGLKPVVK